MLNKKNPINGIESPCVRNCCLDGNDICMGCFRSLDEILAWAGSGNDQRKAILSACNKRRSVARKGLK
ncbi:MAG: DUF1289 domain-containing protein [Pseudomonadales bacterium]|nr:DUF1289 domain-containing protein [Pseudomonadales bacterium]